LLRLQYSLGVGRSLVGRFETKLADLKNFLLILILEVNDFRIFGIVLDFNWGN